MGMPVWALILSHQKHKYMKKQTLPYIMKAHKKGASKEVQSYFLTPDLFTTFMYVPTGAQVKKKPPICSLTMATEKGSTTLISSRYVNIEGMKKYVKDAEQLNKKRRSEQE